MIIDLTGAPESGEQLKDSWELPKGWLASVDPLKPGQTPLTPEWFDVQKNKLKKESGVEKNAASEKAHDIYTPSAAAQKLPNTKQDKFLDSVKPEILKLDPEDEEFVDQATGKLIDGVLVQEYGEHFKRKPAYRQMKKKLTRTILNDPEHREAVEDFLSVLLLAEKNPEQHASGEGVEAE